jgi:hypothetical protein
VHVSCAWLVCVCGRMAITTWLLAPCLVFLVCFGAGFVGFMHSSCIGGCLFRCVSNAVLFKRANDHGHPWLHEPFLHCRGTEPNFLTCWNLSWALHPSGRTIRVAVAYH